MYNELRIGSGSCETFNTEERLYEIIKRDCIFRPLALPPSSYRDVSVVDLLSLHRFLPISLSRLSCHLHSSNSLKGVKRNLLRLPVSAFAIRPSLKVDLLDEPTIHLFSSVSSISRILPFPTV